MAIDWKMIKGKYPKAEKKFCDDTGYKLEDTGNNEYYYFKENGEDCCYCDIEKFFDDNGITINYCKTAGNYNRMSWKIMMNKCLIRYNDDGNHLITRDKAKEYAIPKAYETLEKELNNGTT